MKAFIAIFIFSVVLFIYLHITHHLYVSNDLEVYNLEGASKDKLEEICNLRQPVLFEFNNENINNNCTLSLFEHKYGAFDLNIRNTKNINNNSDMYLPVILKDSINLFHNNGNYITENNYDFLEETGAIKNYMYNDSYLRPPMVATCDYDYMSGSINSKTPLRYMLNYRNYYYVSEGKINIKLIPPSNTKYLHKIVDYENFEFRSPINPWNVDKKYESDYNKVKSLDIELRKGMILYIPSYWWYSIDFTETSSICVFKYKTYMNLLTILPEIILKYMQNQNIKRNVVSKITVKKKKQKAKEEEKQTKEKQKEVQSNKTTIIKKQKLPDIILPEDIVKNNSLTLSKEELPPLI